MSSAIDNVIYALGIEPTLVDVGASGTTPEIWDTIAHRSTYVGFDPDLREMCSIEQGPFRKAVIINEAVGLAPVGETVTFYLTKSPYCSSTLRPDTTSLGNFLFSDLFSIEGEASVRATTLNAVVDRLGLPGVDWLKVDSQGTDLRIFMSLREDLRSKLLAVDIEPGLIDAYVGEDLFVDVHRELIREGFWLANLDVLGAVRMKNSTLRDVARSNRDISRRVVEGTVKTSPGWCEARYLRTVDALAYRSASKRDYALLWIFALLDRQFGFALDLAVEYERAFGPDSTSFIMRSEALAQIRRSRRIATLRAAQTVAVTAARRLKRYCRTNLSKRNRVLV